MTDKLEITQEDWDIAEAIYEKIDGTFPTGDVAEILARHRLQERERCAKVAEGEMVDNQPEVNEDITYNLACRDIATAIRQPKEPSNG